MRRLKSASTLAKAETVYYDAHNHLQDMRLDGVREGYLAKAAGLGIVGGVINGTTCEDWPAVARLARRGWQAAFGIHPWCCCRRPKDWLDRLRAQLMADTSAGVGEVGLDLWIKGADIDDQIRVLEAQLELATELGRAVTLHCLRAWDPLLRVLRRWRVPPQGFLVHAFNGSAEIASQLIELGARFSFSTSFLEPRRNKLRSIYRQLPLDRLLVETDAPAMAPPAGERVIAFADQQGVVNHPQNVIAAYHVLASVMEMDCQRLAVAVERNFIDLFGCE